MRRLTSACFSMFLQALEARGHRLTPLLRKHELPSDAASRCELALPLEDIEAFGEDCARLSGDPFFGLHVGAELPRGAFGLVEFAVRAAPTPRAAIAQLRGAQVLLSGLATIELEESRALARLVHRVEGSSVGLGRQCNDFTLAMLHRRLVELCGAGFSVRRVEFAHPAPLDVAPLDIAPLQRLFQTNSLTFDVGENALVFARAQLDQPSREADAALAKALQAHAKVQLAQRPAATDPVAQVRAAIRDALRVELPTVKHTARTLGVSTRALQRALTAAGTSFGRELDAVRASLAQLYLDQPELPLGEISFLLRYQHVRSFSRAYQRWTGRPLGRSRRVA